MKMKRRIIAALMALCLCIGLLPATALAASGSNTANGSYVSLDYGTGTANLKITVNVFYDGEQVDTFTVNDGAKSGNEMEIRLLGTQQDQYDIESVDINPGGGAILTGSADSWDLGVWSVFDNPDVVINVTLCDQYERPEIVNEHTDWYDLTLEYRLYEPQMLELLYLNGDTGVNKDTTVSSIDVHFVDSYGLQEYKGLHEIGTGANNLPYRFMTLSDVGDEGNPNNIRYLEITYDNNDGRGEKTVKIYSGDLRYVGKKVAGFPIYEIEARDDSESIVAFYIEEGAELSTWSLYDVEFVKDGEALGYDRMPEDPTFPNTQYVFTNWDKNVTGGAPFLPYDPVTDHTVVYAQKTSTSGYGGTEYHAMNTGNALLDRFLELYNTNHNTEYGLNDIDLDSVKIQVNGLDSDATNPNYWNNHWKNNNAYYRIVNSTINLGWQSDTVSNTHVPHEQAQSITIYADVDGTSVEVVIPCGTNPGEIGKSLVQDNIVQLIVNAPPTAPDDEDLTDDPDDPDDTAILGKGAVAVDCINDKAEHDPVTYGLIPGSYTALTDEDVYWANDAEGNGAYYVDITVQDDLYVEAYNRDDDVDVTHRITGEDTKTITLKWVGGEWSVSSATPVTFTVTCEEDDPTEPDFDADDLAGVDVKVICVQNFTDHKYETTLKDAPSTAYTTNIESFEGSFGGVGVDWKCTVSIDTDVFVGLFNSKAAEESWGTHAFSYATPDELVFYYTEASGWLCASDPTFTISVTEQKSQYTLTYDANGGTIDSKETKTVSNIPAEGAENYTLDTTIKPKYADESVLFAGWTLTDTGEEIYSVEDAKNGSVPAAVDAVDLTETKTVYALWSYDEDKDGTPDINEIIVTPADITIYTGGMGYGGVTDAEGNVIDEYEGSGLPKPGYHITLPAGLAAELGLKDGTDLADKLSFSYNVDDEVTGEAVTRAWDMTCAGIYSTDPTRYVYSLNKDSVTNTEVRLLFKDAGGIVKEDDQIDMSANAPSADYTMTINPGGLDQKAIKAVFTVNDGQPVERSVFIDTGVLTIRSITTPDQEVTTPIVASDGSVTGGTITAQAGENMVYHVNDSEVKVDAGRVELLVDEVSGDEDFNKALGEDAISEVKEDEALHASLTNPMYDLAYLDLVDAENGNAVVTVESGKLTIYWPVPAYAADNSDFYVVHYHGGMDRETAVDQNQLADVANTVTKVEKTADGEHITFTTSTFSPFALVYETTSTPPVTQYTVTYDANGGKGAMASQTVNAGGSVTISANAFTRSGYTFTGWNTASDGSGTSYTVGQQVSLTNNLTLYAQWKSTGDSGYDPKEATLRFNSRGGTEFEDEVRDNPFRYNPYNKIPTRPGYRFTGWYDSSRLDDRYDEDEEISVPMGITTVWAGWEETSVPSMLNGDDHYAYIQGYSDGTVRPNANITRAQVATIFFRLLDEDVRDDNLTTYNTFPDVDQDYWANTAISTMASLGVINGRNSGLFDPDAYITRAEFAAICARFDDSGVDGITTFTDTVGHWAEDEISRAAALGWIQGYADGTFRPNQYITRAQAVTMINRVLCRLPEDTDDLLSGMNTWTDCHEDDWFYLAIQEATNSHDFVAKDRVYESWTDLNRAPDWSRYE